MADWDSVSAPVQQPTGWDAVSSPVQAPQVPDMSGVQKTVQQNLTPEPPKEGEAAQPQPPQSPSQKFDTGFGFPAISTMKGANQNTPLDSTWRGHLIDSYKNGSADNSGGFFQNAFQAAAPLLQVGAAAQGIGARAEATLAYPFLSEESRQKLIESGTLGQVPTLTGDPTHDLIAKALTRANALLSPGLGAAYALPASLAAPILNPALETVNKAAGVDNASNLPAAEEFGMNLLGLGGGKFVWDRIQGADTMKAIVGEHLGKPPESVTSSDIDNTIHEGFKDVAPKASDFENTAAVMGVDADYLYNIYKQTGIKPPQVYADVQRDPETMKAINEGLIPPIYDHLIDKRPPIPPEIQSILDKGDEAYRLRKEGEAKAWAKSEEEPIATSKEYAHGLYNQLHQKLGQDTATDIESMQRELAAKDTIGKDLDEKFYLKKEDDSVKLSDEEQKLYDQHVKPLADQERALYEKARALGAEDVEPVSESYVHRIVKGKGHYLDKYDTEFGADEDIGFGKVRGISQTTGSLEEAQFHALEDKQGNRVFKIGEMPKGYELDKQIANEHRIVNLPKDYILKDELGNKKTVRGKLPEGYKIGDKYKDETGKEWTIGASRTKSEYKYTDESGEELKLKKNGTAYSEVQGKSGDKYVDEDGKEWTIKRAKTSEIEANTDLRYYKSAIGNTEENIRKLDKTIRNIEFLNGLKDDMEKTKLGVPPSESYHPAGYQQVTVPQLRGWSFDPRIAEVINDIYDHGGDTMLGRINNVLIKGMFLNPIPHVENVFYDYLASRGWKNAQAIKGVNYIAQGIKDVKEFSPEYLDVLKRGGALKLPSVWKAEFFNQMERQFLKEMQSSKEGLDLAKSWGFDTVPAMAEKVFNTSQKALWGSGDAFLMAKIRELKDGGMSTDKAIEEAQKHIIDYRIPPRIGEDILGPQFSRMLSRSLQNNAVVVFTRYHYGLFKALGNSVKDLVTGIAGMDAAKASTGAGQLFATYLLLTVVNPMISNMWSSITGQKEQMRNPGSTGLMGAVLDFASGKKTLGQALKSQFIVSPGIQVGADIRNDKIVNPKLGHEGVQLMDYLMKQPTMSVPAIPYNIREGKQSLGEEALRQVGVTPQKDYKEKKPSRKSVMKLEKEEKELLGEQTP